MRWLTVSILSVVSIFCMIIHLITREFSCEYSCEMKLRAVSRAGIVFGIFTSYSNLKYFVHVVERVFNFTTLHYRRPWQVQAWWVDFPS